MKPEKRVFKWSEDELTLLADEEIWFTEAGDEKYVNKTLRKRLTHRSVQAI